MKKATNEKNTGDYWRIKDFRVLSDAFWLFLLRNVIIYIYN